MAVAESEERASLLPDIPPGYMALLTMIGIFTFIFWPRGGSGEGDD